MGQIWSFKTIYILFMVPFVTPAFSTIPASAQPEISIS